MFPQPIEGLGESDWPGWERPVGVVFKSRGSDIGIIWIITLHSCCPCVTLMAMLLIMQSDVTSNIDGERGLGDGWPVVTIICGVWPVRAVTGVPGGLLTIADVTRDQRSEMCPGLLYDGALTCNCRWPMFVTDTRPTPTNKYLLRQNTNSKIGKIPHTQDLNYHDISPSLSLYPLGESQGIDKFWYFTERPILRAC